jgi:hypothetical protein
MLFGIQVFFHKNIDDMEIFHDVVSDPVALWFNQSPKIDHKKAIKKSLLYLSMPMTSAKLFLTQHESHFWVPDMILQRATITSHNA